MIKFNLAALAILTTLLFSACSGEDVQAAVGKVEQLDLSNLNPAELTTKFQDIGGELKTKLGSITDLASAKDIVAQVQPLLENATQLKTALGDKLPSLDSLGSLATDLTEKFKGEGAILDVLKPVIEKLTALVG